MTSSTMHSAGRSPKAAVSSLTGPRRIAAIIAANEVTGPGRQLVTLAVELAAQGVAISILLLSRPGAPSTFAAFANANGIECRVMTDRSPFDPRLLREIRAFVASWQPDVIETHGYKPTSLMFALRALGVGCPWVGFFEGQTDKGFKDRFYHLLDLHMLRAADRVVVMSDLQRAMFPARASNVRVIDNAVPRLSHAADLETLHPVLRRRRGSGAVPLIGAIGRLSREKGVDVLLDALAILKAQGIAAHAAIIGGGPLESDLKLRAWRLGLDAEVTFTGPMDMVRDVYDALDLMVIPSRSEGLPSVLLEALPADLPVVSTRVGAMIGIAAEEPDSMRIVPTESPGMLSEAMAEAIGDLASPAAAAARARVAAIYSIERRGGLMLDVFRQAIAARGVR